MGASDRRAFEGRRLGAASSEGDGTVNYYLKLDGYTQLGLQWDVTNGGAGDYVITVAATMDPDPEAALSSKEFVDKTNDWFGAATFTADDFVEQSNIIAYAIRVRVVRNNDGGNNDGAHTVWAKRIA